MSRLPHSNLNIGSVLVNKQRDFSALMLVANLFVFVEVGRAVRECRA